MRTIRRLFLFLLVAAGSTNLFAQTKFLHRKVTLDIPNCSLEVALREIGKAGHFRFSYDADQIRDDRKVQLKANDLPVNSLLKEILGNEVSPREVGNHVILIRNKSAATKKRSLPEIVITGTILQASSRFPLGDATIYEIASKKSAISNTNGHYKLVIPSGRNIKGLAYCKTGFVDTVIFPKQVREIKLDILLRSSGESLSRMDIIKGSVSRAGTDSMQLVRWLVPHETMVNSQNLEVRSPRMFQASVLPYVGTNWKITGSVTNKISLNLLAGYTGGLNGVEVGGLLNITKNSINGLQIGGLGNIVGGDGKGWQVGGLFNIDLKKVDGVQFGGLFNYVPDTLRGIQVAGLANIVPGRIKGIQIAGLTNIVTHNCDGWQISGLLNLTFYDVKRTQIAGLANYGRNIDGVQVAGLINIARRHNSGLQLAGLVNYATILNGVQLGIINIANTVERGVPIGLFSYVQKGYHLFELSGNEIFYGNLSFKTGTRTFYNFVQFGIGSSYKLQGSYGIGTIFTLNRRLSASIDASAGFVYHPADTIYHGLLLKFNPSLEYRFAKHFAMFAGPAYNCFVFSKGKPSATARGLSTYDFYFKSTENASIQMWIGGVLGVRF
ncbi:MAG: hypothetical protein ACOYNC_02835 [Bacteroidales bacterium]